MSIYDRDYYKQQTNPDWGQSPYRKSFQPFQGIPPVVKWLLMINIAVYLITLFLGNIPFFSHVARNSMGYIIGQKPSDFDLWFGLYNPNFIGHFAFWQLITYQFIHGGFLHILFNMFSLYMIGRFVEKQIGSVPFLKLYLLGGIFAGMINVLTNMFSGLPTVGASGAICAIVAAFGLMNPNARIGFLVLFFPIFMKAKTFVYVFAIFTIFMALGGRGNIAHMAHLGGLVFGWLYAYNKFGIGNLINGSGSTVSFASGSFFSNLKYKMGAGPKVYKGEEFEDANFKEVNSHGNSSGKWDSRIDDVLDKMSRHGIHSLTDEEWELLDKHKKGKL
ncbi:MAG: hypothetical protein DRI44_03520 [Chlamydiae bacterium]|nr:MAG: hypothetical protein DRI44_03520 [Chlamydiota bacterium]